MSKQTGLFNSLPNLTKDTKKKNKEILNKANGPKKKSKTVVKASSKDKMKNRISMLIQTAKQYYGDGEKEKYLLIDSAEQLEAYLKKAEQVGEMGLDTESDLKGKNPDPMEDSIAGIGIYTPGEKPAYIPLFHKDMDGKVLDGQIPLESVQEIFSRYTETIKYIYHNAVYDIRVMINATGVVIPNYWCTQVAGSYLNENESHRLKDLWDKYCNKESDKKSAHYSDLFHGIPFSYVPLDIAKIYGGGDPKKTYELYQFQKPFLTPNSPQCIDKGLNEAAEFFHETEMPLVDVLVEMEEEGVDIDSAYGQELSERYHKKIDLVEEKIFNRIKTFDLTKLKPELQQKLNHPEGKLMNLNSPQQLAILFYDLMKLKSPDREKPRGTGEEILEHFASKQIGELKEFFQDILEYRGLAKLLSTYIDKMPKILKTRTGKLHGRFNQYGAKTGRFSSSDPNLQNIPSKNKEIRKMFIAPEGFVFVGADYSQQEPRVLAHVSNDINLINAYKDNKDLYAWIASIIYDVDYDECKEFRQDGSKNTDGKKRRDSVKSIVLGLMYGRGIPSIAEQLGLDYKETERIVNLFFDRFPKIKETIENYQEMAATEGFVPTVYGVKRRLPDISLPEYQFKRFKGETEVPDEIQEYYYKRLGKAFWRDKQAIKDEARKQGIRVIDNGGKIAEAERQVLNSIIQGTSANITKKAMVAVGKNQQLKELGFKLLLTVHDEIIGKAPRETALKSADLVIQLMIEAAEDKISVPMKVDPEIVERWYGEPVEFSKSEEVLEVKQ